MGLAASKYPLNGFHAWMMEGGLSPATIRLYLFLVRQTLAITGMPPDQVDLLRHDARQPPAAQKKLRAAWARFVMYVKQSRDMIIPQLPRAQRIERDQQISLTPYRLALAPILRQFAELTNLPTGGMEQLRCRDVRRGPRNLGVLSCRFSTRSESGMVHTPEINMEVPFQDGRFRAFLSELLEVAHGGRRIAMDARPLFPYDPIPVDMPEPLAVNVKPLPAGVMHALILHAGGDPIRGWKDKRAAQYIPGRARRLEGRATATKIRKYATATYTTPSPPRPSPSPVQPSKGSSVSLAAKGSIPVFKAGVPDEDGFIIEALPPPTPEKSPFDLSLLSTAPAPTTSSNGSASGAPSTAGALPPSDPRLTGKS